MKNTMHTQLTNMGFTKNGIEYRLEWNSDMGVDVVRMVSVFSNDDGQWNGYISVKGEAVVETWDGTQPLDDWMESVENAYWDK